MQSVPCSGFDPAFPSHLQSQKEHLGSHKNSWAEKLCKCHFNIKDITREVFGNVYIQIVCIGRKLFFFFLIAERRIERQIIAILYEMSILRKK